MNFFDIHVPEYVLQQYQGAAVNACLEFQISPYGPNAIGEPNWVVMAREMHKMNVMRKHMVMNGLSPF